MTKRCEAMLEKIDGEYEQCDGVAVHGMDHCQMCIDMADPQFVRSMSEPAPEDWNQ
jgi:hypothetical protein